jgi:hypothetical protein
MKAHFKLTIPIGIITIDLEDLGHHEDVSFEDLCDEHKKHALNAIRNSVSPLINIIPA